MRRHLSRAEKQVAMLMALGLTNADIARARGTTFYTAKSQVRHVITILGVNRARLTVAFLEEQERTT